MPRGEDDPRLICRCLGVASPRVYAAVRAHGLRDLAGVTKAVRAGGGCGLCHPELEEVLAEVHGAPLDPGLVLENRLVCREETRVRVAGALEHAVRPRLARLGVTLAGYEIDGLCVRVRLAGGGDEEAALAVVRATLRACLCPDLEVQRLAAAAPDRSGSLR